ncbi:AB-hydrolase YheT [Lactarius quietus]|nr:AB-hydrolase YheT [Lactarius quietus]
MIRESYQLRGRLPFVLQHRFFLFATTMGSALSTLSHRPGPRTYFSSKTASIPLRQSASETTSLRVLLETYCPSLFSPFRPSWWLFNGHLQTFYAVAGDFSAVDTLAYDRQLLGVRDGGTLGIDFTPPISERVLPEETPIIVVLHGLTGGSQEPYVRDILAPAVTPIDQGGLGYRAVVVNSRGCAGVPLTSPQLYSSCHTDDLRQALLYISHRYPRAPLLGLGFSLGANVLTRYVAEEGDECRLTSACVLACPWNLTVNAHALHSDLVHRHIYAKGLGGNLKRLVSRHVDSIMKFPNSTLAQSLPELFSRKSITLEQFDGLITIHSGGTSPPFPFASTHDYYTYASSHRVLEDVRIPFLAINSDDDPIVKYLPVKEADNKWVTLVVTRGGGHMGWFERTGNRVKRWIRQPTLEWFKATVENIEGPQQPVRTIRFEDGWLVESGKEHLGCKDIGKGGRVEDSNRQKDLLAGL